MSELHLIESTLAKTAQRRRLERGFRRLWQGLLIGAAVWLALMVVYKLAPVPDEWITYSWLNLPIAALIGFIWGFSRPVTLQETARWVDGQRKLQERLSTALEVARTDQAGEWKSLVVSDAAKSVSGLKPKELLPFRLPQASRWALTRTICQLT